MNTEVFGVISIFIISLVLAIPLGRYIAKIYAGDKTLLDPIFNPIEKLIFKVSGINAIDEMNWKQHLKALLSVNMVWFFLCFFVLLTQGMLPLNPDNNPSMTADLAFNTAISFLVNCNLQHYSGESGLSYLSQMVLMFLQFVSAGIGMAAAAMVFLAMKERATDKLGNFYNFFLKSCIRVLLPLSAVV
ncbi:MAG: potassium-transporting ATPase subunit KdpA, partial [Methylotenera sp.]|nr:potassium-transporting ATPase subunit KdpA [Flavobacterium sp.]